jgi:hypothetical protein
MKQTAVEYLSEKYMYVTWLRNRDEKLEGQADKMMAHYLTEAKEMEKEQMYDAYKEGFVYFPTIENFNEYYKESYKSNEKHRG